MCGIVAIVGEPDARDRIARAVQTLHHRGPDGSGVWHAGPIALGHTRLRIIDLSDAGRQPMTSANGRYTIVFNGEVYNYLELRAELDGYPFVSKSDTEVVLAAWLTWGEACLDRFIGMFAFAVWDATQQKLVAVRDRFGVKPLYIGRLPAGGIVVASEIKALRAAGVETGADRGAWATYLATGALDGSRTFWRGVEAIPAGCLVTWRAGQLSSTRRWYDLAARVGPDYDERPESDVRDEYLALLDQSVRLRFRSDVPVGINLSGGVDSSTLLGLVHAVQGAESQVEVFTFATGDARYDELPWVEAMLARTRHPLVTCMLSPGDVPALATRIAEVEDEPFGGLPTLAYANLFARARERGVIVLLDGQGMDEQWAGYDYYRTAGAAPVVQGTVEPAVRVDCLSPELRALVDSPSPHAPFSDRLRNLQLRDLLVTKLPRALRFNDRASMAASTELREPFLDHRLVELALRQPEDRKIRGDQGKFLLREIAASLLPDQVRHAPKRALQTPQREWLRGPLRDWANSLIESAFALRADWFDVPLARQAWRDYTDGSGDNSFWVWQWLSIGLGPA
jgi:asparagine synthase (glutamine-hydrolysing)